MRQRFEELIWAELEELANVSIQAGQTELAALPEPLLLAILAGELSSTRVGEYLKELKERFSKADIADLVCLIRLHAELSISAKGLMMRRKAGFETPRAAGIASRFEELAHLEKTIGRAGRLALAPIFSMSHRELWQLHMLREN